MQKILLLGKNGQLGKALKKELSGDFEVSDFGKNELDILDFSKIAEICGKLNPNFLVNAAAYTAVDRAEAEQDLALKINSEAVGNLAKICKKSRAKLIHFSTDYVFDGKRNEGFAEDDEPNPINFYGESKLAGERKILESGCNFAIIRTSWLFGAGKNFAQTMLELAKNNPEIKVVSDQTGCPTFTEDLAEATKNLMFTGQNGIFHLTNAGVTNWADFARKIFELAAPKVKVIDIPTSEYPTPAHRPNNSVLLNTKLPKLRSWEEGLGEYLEKN